ncbi:unnamed protein product [Diatraea saccharalis]|uniref:Uncharacterized protein n=1 Tax=Diatraea saccharalis TaxID=40085 RepID=A0A9N9R8F5_9NEOP|nr:unnamed protein product [Diatraea saccharalis]
MNDTSKKLKCANRNIVICEVLAFVQNKLDVMDEQGLIQICESAFSTADIDLAKSLLFESLSKRSTTRKGQGKTFRDLKDIICLFKETDPEKIPMFVAKKLEKLPPVTFDHVDITALLKRIVLLEQCTRDFKHQYATKIDLNDRISDTISSINQERNVNMQKRGVFKLFNSGPMALPTLSVVTDDSLCNEHSIDMSPATLSHTQQSPCAAE